VPIKTREPTHVDSEAVELFQTFLNNLEDQRVVFRTAKGWIARVIRKEGV